MRVWIAIVLLAGCMGDDDGHGPFTPVDQIDEAYRTALCTHLVACHEVTDQATCLATNVYPTAIVGDVYVDPLTVQAVLDGKVRYDGSAVAACMSAFAATSCNPGDVANRTSVGQCMFDVFHGLVHAGALCHSNVECISAQCALNCGEDEDASCCTGTCVGDTAPAPFVPIRIGQTCPQGSAGYNACEPAAYCDSSTSICTALKPAGTTCNGTNECADGLQCDVFGTLTCVSAPHAGDPCTPSGRCGDEANYCGNDQRCHPPALTGQACGAGELCSQAYLTCAPATETCVTYPHTGEDCTESFRCNDLGTTCTNTVCTAPSANGAACETNVDCASHYCDAGTLLCVATPSCPL